MLALLPLLASLSLAAVEPAEVLVLGPLPVSAHALAERKEAEAMRRALLRALIAAPPAAGRSLAFPGATLSWRPRSPAPAGPGSELWALYLDAPRLLRVRLELKGLEAPLVWLEQERIALQAGSAELVLRPGRQRLLIAHDGPLAGEALVFRIAGDPPPLPGLEPRRRVSAERLSNAATVERLAVDHDGRWLALAFRRRDEPSGTVERWLELRELPAGRLRQTLPLAVDELAFGPAGRLALRSGMQLHILDPEAGSLRLIVPERKGLAAPRWLADGSLLALAAEPFEGREPAALKRYAALEDRWPEFREPLQLYRIDAASGLLLPLTARPLGVRLLDVHPRRPRALLAERLIDYAEPPHERFRVFELDLERAEERELGRWRQIEALRYRPGGGLLALAGPEAFGGICLEPGLAAGNDYELELFELGEDGTPRRCLTREFRPALARLERAGGTILALAHDGDRILAYRLGASGLEPLPFALEVIEDLAAAAGGRVIAAAGSRGDAPQRVELLDGQRLRIPWDGRGEYPDLELGELRPFRFRNREGLEIDGRVYLPPDFDPGRRWPVIVYWYGGTLPVTRAFTGRYPFHLWAAHGYLVYVLQPQGTIGYGQRFSARHLNAWGRGTAEDILEGVDAFLAAHPFADPERVGGIGASYGGFMSMFLATRTARFRALVAHAGISLLPAYWGEGFWGYSYSGVASRGSFPWNAPELYVGQSPLFAADRITTPLLLLTGDRDRNVPPGESHAMFTALRLLGREVELVEVAGEDHWILDPAKRYAWWETMLAWFDRHLKAQPEWWERLFPERPGIRP